MRIFKLNTGQDDHAIMFLDDYLKQVGLYVCKFINDVMFNFQLQCQLVQSEVLLQGHMNLPLGEV